MAGVKENLFILTPLSFKMDKTALEGKSVNVTENVEKYDPLIFCRTCANIDSCFVQIFKDEGIFYELNSKIEKYLPIKVSEKDDLPLQICYHCASTIVAWDNLLVGCVEAEKKLTLLKNSLGEKESKQLQENNKGEVAVQNVDSDDEPLIAKKPSRISNKIEEKREILQEKTLETTNVESERLMEEPDLSFTTYQHRFKILGPFLSQILGLRIDNPKCCNVCANIKNIKFSFKKLILKGEGSFIKSKIIPNKLKIKKRKHLIETVRQMTCKDCGKVLSNEKNLNNHMKIHFNEKSLTCHVCGKAFRHRFSLLRHVKVVHERALDHVCNDCGKKYRSSGDLEDHRNVHKGQWILVCEVCGRIFLTKASFYPHKNSHQKKNRKKKSLEHYCEKCCKKFTTKKSRDQHLLIHTGEKPLDCTICGKKFRTKTNYRQHEKIHSNVKPYVCNHCGKGFKRKDHLKIHLRCHTGEKPFLCNFCGKAFARGNDMKKHCKVHEKKS